MSTSAMRAEENNTRPSHNTHTFGLLSCQCVYFCRRPECHGQKVLESSSFARRLRSVTRVCLSGLCFGKGFLLRGHRPMWLARSPPRKLPQLCFPRSPASDYSGRQKRCHKGRASLERPGKPITRQTLSTRFPFHVKRIRDVPRNNISRLPRF